MTTIAKADVNDPAKASAIIDSLFGNSSTPPATPPVNPPADPPANPPVPPVTPPVNPPVNPPAEPPKETQGLFDVPSEDPDKGANPYDKIAERYQLAKPEDDPEFAWSEENIFDHIDQKIEQSRKTLNLEDYDPDARKVIEYFTEKKGSLVDFYKNSELAEVEKYKAMNDQQLWELNATNGYVKLGFTEVEAQTKVQADIETLGEKGKMIFKSFAETARLNLDKYASQVIQQTIEEKNKFIEQQNQKTVQKATEERTKMVKELKKLTSFMGVSLSDSDKAYVEKEITSGKFLEKINTNNAKSQLYAYLSNALQDKIVKTYEEILKNGVNQEKSRAMIEFLKSTFNAVPPGGTAPKGSGAVFNPANVGQVNSFLNNVLGNKQ